MTRVIDITPTRLNVNEGQFDTQKRYLRASGAGLFLPIPHGRTVDLKNQTLTQTDPTTDFVSCRYSLNGYVQRETKTFNGLLGSDAVSPGSFNASRTLVKF